MVEAYNSAKTIEKTLESLRGHVDRVLVADGYFPYLSKYKFQGAKSTDETERIVKKYGESMICSWLPVPAEYAEKGYPSEMAKQNYMLRFTKENDWLFWIATDEQLIGGQNLRDFRDHIGSDAIPIKIHTTFHPSLKEETWYDARLHRHVPEMKYEDQHYIVSGNIRYSLFMRDMPFTTYIRHDKRGD